MIAGISDAIQSQRLSKGYSVYELSQRSGVSQQAIAYYEKQVRRPNLDCLAKIARGLDLQLSELIAVAEKKVGK